VIDIIFGDVFVVLARFLATEVVTLRCNKLSDMESLPQLGCSSLKRKWHGERGHYELEKYKLQVSLARRASQFSSKK
jgi:hypothetical protein